MATQAELGDEIRQQFGDTSTAWSGDTEVERWVQDAHYQIARKTHYLRSVFQDDLVADQESYSLADITTTRRLLILEDVLVLHDSGTTYYRCTPMPWWQYRKYMDGLETTTTPSSTSTPDRFVYHGDYLYLHPTPSYDETNAIRLYGICAQEFSANTENSTIPDQFHEGVMWYGLWRAALKDEEPGQARYYLQMYDDIMRELSAWAKSDKHTYPTRVATPGERGIVIG